MAAHTSGTSDEGSERLPGHLLIHGSRLVVPPAPQVSSPVTTGSSSRSLAPGLQAQSTLKED